MNLADLHEEVVRIPGLAGVESGERAFLINEGMRELAVRSEWTKTTRNLGNTVAGTAAYAIPADVYRILHVAVDNVPVASGDEQMVQSVIDGDLYLRARAVYYTSFDSSGVEKLYLYPTPDTDGLTINALCVYRPADLATNGIPPLPAEFHRNIVHYAAFNLLTAPEDADRRDFYQTQYEMGCERLRQLRLARQNRGPILMQIQGVHW